MVSSRNRRREYASDGWSSESTDGDADESSGSVEWMSSSNGSDSDGDDGTSSMAYTYDGGEGSEDAGIQLLGDSDGISEDGDGMSILSESPLVGPLRTLLRRIVKVHKLRRELLNRIDVDVDVIRSVRADEPFEHVEGNRMQSWLLAPTSVDGNTGTDAQSKLIASVLETASHFHRLRRVNNLNVLLLGQAARLLRDEQSKTSDAFAKSLDIHDREHFESLTRIIEQRHGFCECLEDHMVSAPTSLEAARENVRRTREADASLQNLLTSEEVTSISSDAVSTAPLSIVCRISILYALEELRRNTALHNLKSAHELQQLSCFISQLTVEGVRQNFLSPVSKNDIIQTVIMEKNRVKRVVPLSVLFTMMEEEDLVAEMALLSGLPAVLMQRMRHLTHSLFGAPTFPILTTAAAPTHTSHGIPETMRTPQSTTTHGASVDGTAATAGSGASNTRGRPSGRTSRRASPPPPPSSTFQNPVSHRNRTQSRRSSPQALHIARQSDNASTFDQAAAAAPAGVADSPLGASDTLPTGEEPQSGGEPLRPIKRKRSLPGSGASTPHTSTPLLPERVSRLEEIRMDNNGDGDDDSDSLPSTPRSPFSATRVRDLYPSGGFESTTPRESGSGDIKKPSFETGYPTSVPVQQGPVVRPVPELLIGSKVGRGPDWQNQPSAQGAHADYGIVVGFLRSRMEVLVQWVTSEDAVASKAHVIQAVDVPSSPHTPVNPDAFTQTSVADLAKNTDDDPYAQTILPGVLGLLNSVEPVQPRIFRYRYNPRGIREVVPLELYLRVACVLPDEVDFRVEELLLSFAIIGALRQQRETILPALQFQAIETLLHVLDSTPVQETAEVAAKLISDVLVGYKNSEAAKGGAEGAAVSEDIHSNIDGSSRLVAAALTTIDPASGMTMVDVGKLEAALAWNIEVRKAQDERRQAREVVARAAWVVRALITHKRLAYLFLDYDGISRVMRLVNSPRAAVPTSLLYGCSLLFAQLGRVHIFSEVLAHHRNYFEDILDFAMRQLREEVNVDIQSTMGVFLFNALSFQSVFTYFDERGGVTLLLNIIGKKLKESQDQHDSIAPSLVLVCLRCLHVYLVSHLMMQTRVVFRRHRVLSQLLTHASPDTSLPRDGATVEAVFCMLSSTKPVPVLLDVTVENVQGLLASDRLITINNLVHQLQVHTTLLGCVRFYLAQSSWELLSAALNALCVLAVVPFVRRYIAEAMTPEPGVAQLLSVASEAAEAAFSGNRTRSAHLEPCVAAALQTLLLLLTTHQCGEGDDVAAASFNRVCGLVRSHDGIRVLVDTLKANKDTTALSAKIQHFPVVARAVHLLVLLRTYGDTRALLNVLGVRRIALEVLTEYSKTQKEFLSQAPMICKFGVKHESMGYFMENVKWLATDDDSSLSSAALASSISQAVVDPYELEERHAIVSRAYVDYNRESLLSLIASHLDSEGLHGAASLVRKECKRPISDGVVTAQSNFADVSAAAHPTQNAIGTSRENEALSATHASSATSRILSSPVHLPASAQTSVGMDSVSSTLNSTGGSSMHDRSRTPLPSPLQASSTLTAPGPAPSTSWRREQFGQHYQTATSHHATSPPLSLGVTAAAVAAAGLDVGADEGSGSGSGALERRGEGGSTSLTSPLSPLPPAGRVTLDGIMRTYLREQQEKCPKPIATLPPFDLTKSHVYVPPPAQVDFTEHVFNRTLYMRLGGACTQSSSRYHLNASNHSSQFFYSHPRLLFDIRGRDDGLAAESLAFCDNGDSIIIGTADGLAIFDTFPDTSGEKLREQHVVFDSEDNIAEVVVSYDGSLVAAVGDTHSIKVMRRDALPNAVLTILNDNVKTIRFSHDSKIAVTTLDDMNNCEIYDLERGEVVTKFDGGASSTVHSSSSNGDNVAMFDATSHLVLNDAILWDARCATQPIFRFDRFTENFASTFLPMNTQVLIDGNVWDLRTLTMVTTVKALQNSTSFHMPRSGRAIYGFRGPTSLSVSKAPVLSIVDTVNFETFLSSELRPPFRVMAVDPSDRYFAGIHQQEMDAAIRVFGVGMDPLLHVSGTAVGVLAGAEDQFDGDAENGEAYADGNPSGIGGHDDDDDFSMFDDGDGSSFIVDDDDEEDEDDEEEEDEDDSSDAETFTEEETATEGIDDEEDETNTSETIPYDSDETDENEEDEDEEDEEDVDNNTFNRRTSPLVAPDGTVAVMSKPVTLRNGGNASWQQHHQPSRNRKRKRENDHDAADSEENLQDDDYNETQSEDST